MYFSNVLGQVQLSFESLQLENEKHINEKTIFEYKIGSL